MGKSVAVNVIQAVQHLLKEVAPLGLCQAATQRDEVEKFTPTDQLEDDVVNQSLAFVWIYLVALADLVKSDNIVVCGKLGQSLELALDHLRGVFCLVENLDGIALARLVLGELDFAGGTHAERPPHDILVVEYNWHHLFLSLNFNFNFKPSEPCKYF